MRRAAPPSRLTSSVVIRVPTRRLAAGSGWRVSRHPRGALQRSDGGRRTEGARTARHSGQPERASLLRPGGAQKAASRARRRLVQVSALAGAWSSSRQSDAAGGAGARAGRSRTAHRTVSGTLPLRLRPASVTASASASADGAPGGVWPTRALFLPPTMPTTGAQRANFSPPASAGRGRK